MLTREKIGRQMLILIPLAASIFTAITGIAMWQDPLLGYKVMAIGMACAAVTAAAVAAYLPKSRLHKSNKGYLGLGFVMAVLSVVIVIPVMLAENGFQFISPFFSFLFWVFLSPLPIIGNLGNLVATGMYLLVIWQAANVMVAFKEILRLIMFPPRQVHFVQGDHVEVYNEEDISDKIDAEDKNHLRQNTRR
jgi:hypothetical protein